MIFGNWIMKPNPVLLQSNMTLVYEPGDITRQSHAWSTRALGSLHCVNQEINTSWKT